MQHSSSRLMKYPSFLVYISSLTTPWRSTQNIMHIHNDFWCLASTGEQEAEWKNNSSPWCSGGVGSLTSRSGLWEHFARCCHRLAEGELRLLIPRQMRLWTKRTTNLCCTKLKAPKNIKWICSTSSAHLTRKHFFPLVLIKHLMWWT